VQCGGVSFWYQELGGLPKPSPALSRPISADICIIGAGFTGLWAAYYLKKADPSLNIVIVEEHFAGFGASGRNGGWLSGNFAWDHEKYLSSGTVEQVKAMVAAFHGTVDEVDHRNQLESEAQLRARVAIPSARGALVTSGVARIQPAKFVRGLANAVVRLGVTIYETTRAHKVSKGQVITDQGRVACAVVLKATEGYSAQLPGYKRNWLPLNSAQIVTEPLPPELWRDIGWSGAELIGDMAHAYCYCQRTADGRIAVGGRGLPYLLNSKIQQDGRF